MVFFNKLFGRSKTKAPYSTFFTQKNVYFSSKTRPDWRVAMNSFVLATLLAGFVFTSALAAPSQEAITLAENAFAARSVAERDAALKKLSGRSGDDLAVAIYAQGAAGFFGALERLAQDLHRHGFESPTSFMLPLLRLPVPAAESVEPLDYAGFRQIIERFHAGLMKSAGQLALMPPGGYFGIVVDLHKLALDMNGDGAMSENEQVARIISEIGNSRPRGMRSGQSAQADAAPLIFRFDRADAIWLQGYANVLAAQADFWLAHDFQDSFDNSFHMLFPRAGLPLQDALVPKRLDRSGMLGQEWRIADFISFIHFVSWPVVEPERRQRTRTELLEMVALSRKNWDAIQAETDNDREWLPGPQQPGVNPLTGLAVGVEQVNGWKKALDLAEDLLNGKKLMPHFRFPDRGMDMKRFFENPQTFDLVATFTGPAAIPYLAQGDIVTASEFNDLRRAFGRNNFASFAIWFN